MANRPCSPPLIKGGVGERTLRLSKERNRARRDACLRDPAPRTPPTSRTPRTPRPPRRRDKRAPPGEGETGAELRSNATQATRVRALLGPGPTTLGTVYGPGPGAPVGVLK